MQIPIAAVPTAKAQQQNSTPLTREREREASPVCSELNRVPLHSCDFQLTTYKSSARPRVWFGGSSWGPVKNFLNTQQHPSIYCGAEELFAKQVEQIKTHQRLPFRCLESLEFVCLCHPSVTTTGVVPIGLRWKTIIVVVHFALCN